MVQFKAGGIDSGYASKSTAIAAHTIQALDHQRFFGSSLMPSFRVRVSLKISPGP
jgi:hypothetical protein